MIVNKNKEILKLQMKMKTKLYKKQNLDKNSLNIKDEMIKELKKHLSGWINIAVARYFHIFFLFALLCC